MATKKQSLFQRLSEVDVSKYVEKKGNLDYLSWAGALIYMHENCSVFRFEKNFFQVGNIELPYTIDHDGWAFVRVTVTADEKTVTEVFPVLNYANKAIQNPNSFQVNTAHQRCLVKCCAYLGLGIGLYLNEDLRESSVVAKEVDPEVLKELMLSAEQGVTFLKVKWNELKGKKLDGFTQDHKKDLHEIAKKADEKEADRNAES
jgi:hypothetical protein|tara:strand:- start:36 stop:644 length:609 start_codon:yes stop_codon:yes gene_type:complete